MLVRVAAESVAAAAVSESAPRAGVCVGAAARAVRRDLLARGDGALAELGLAACSAVCVGDTAVKIEELLACIEQYGLRASDPKTITYHQLY